MKTIEEVREKYKIHHIASARGYESRRGNGHVEEYNGRFGTGYKHIIPRHDTNRYVYVAYYTIKK